MAAPVYPLHRPAFLIIGTAAPVAAVAAATVAAATADAVDVSAAPAAQTAATTVEQSAITAAAEKTAGCVADRAPVQERERAPLAGGNASGGAVAPTAAMPLASDAGLMSRFIGLFRARPHGAGPLIAAESPRCIPKRPAANCLFAVQRIMEQSPLAYVRPVRAVRIGRPLMVSLPSDACGFDLYDRIMQQLRRYVELAPLTSERDTSTEDAFPFTLAWVDDSGMRCSRCCWTRFCLGCRIPDSRSEPLDMSGAFIAVDWRPRIYYLRYLPEEEQVRAGGAAALRSASVAAQPYTDARRCGVQRIEQHESVQKCLELQSEERMLEECLMSFTKEEELGAGEMWCVANNATPLRDRAFRTRRPCRRCPRCQDFRKATKKLDLWRLPPVLVIRPPCVARDCARSSMPQIIHLKRFVYVRNHWVKASKRIAYAVDDFDTSRFVLSPTPTVGADAAADAPNSGHTYDLMCVSHHVGLIGGGHYVAEVRHVNGKWYLFNDSECSETTPDKSGHASAYVLVYERRGINYEAMLPKPRIVATATDGDGASAGASATARAAGPAAGSAAGAVVAHGGTYGTPTSGCTVS